MTRLIRERDQFTNLPRFSVVFLNWEDFFDAIIKPEEHKSIWIDIARAHCLIGGADMSLSWL